MLNIREINPYIRLAMPSVLPKGFTLRRRVIFDYELLFVESGTFTLTYGEASYVVAQGSILLLRPGVPHRFFLHADDVSQPHIHFDICSTENSPIIPISFKDISAMSAQERAWISEDVFAQYRGDPFLRISDRARFLALFYSVIDTRTPSLEKKGLLTALLSMVIADNYPLLLEDNVKETYPIERVIRSFIDAGQGMNMCLDDFAEQFSYSKFYIEKRFRAAYGVALIDYRDQKRMEIAKKHLLEHTVSETAAKVGYTSIFSFSRAYKKHFGVPPTAHRSVTDMRLR